MGSSNVNLLARIGGDSSGFTQAIGEVNAALDAANRRAQATTGGFRAFGEQLGSIGSALSIGITLPVIGLGAAVINSAANMDSLKRGLIAVSGSSAEAERQLSALKEVAKLPGLGLKEAVQGSINLQAVGNSAEQSQRILKVFGNALATVGRGREDLQETIRQLGQLGSRGVVTADNLKPLIERIPQLSTIIREKFGPEALGNPAETFKKLGINSKEFIEIILTELGKLPMVTGGAKNAIENFKDAVDQTAARIGEKLLPAVEALLPKLEVLAVGVADAVDGFIGLPKPIQDAALALGGFALAAGPLLSVSSALVRIGVAIRSVIGYLSLLTPATAALGLALAYTVSIGPKIVSFFSEMAQELDPLNAKSNDFVRTILRNFPVMEQSIRALNSSIGGLNNAPSTFQILSDTTGKFRSQVLGLYDPMKKNTNAMQEAIMAAAGIKDSYQDIQKEITKLREAEKSMLDLGRAGVVVSGNLALIRKEIGEKLKQAAAGAKPAIDELANAFTRLGVANTTDAIGSFVLARTAFEVVQKAYKEGKTSSVDLQRATESLGSEYLKLIDGLGKVTPKLTAVGEKFDFVRERSMLAMGDISSAFNGARNLSLSQLIVPGGQANNPALNEAQNRADGKRRLEFIRENVKDSLSEYKIAQDKIRQAISTITTDFSKGIADIITNGGKIGELFERLGKQIANTLIRTVIEGGINQVTKSLGGLLTSLGGVGAKVGGLFGGVAKAGSGAAIPGVLGGAANAAIPGITAGAPAASSSLGSIAAAANPIVAMVTAVSSVVSAISAVFANFQFAAINKTLDLIEREVRYTKIYTGGQSNSILNTAHDSLEALRSIAASTKGLIGINIIGTLNDAQTQRLIDDLLNGSGSFYAQSARTLTAIHQAIVSGFDVLTGQVNAANKQNIFQKIFSGGALSSGSLFGGLGQGLSGAFSSAVGGVINSAVGGAKESTLGAVEKEVRFSQIHLLNILENINQYLPKLADIHQRLVEIIVDGLKIREGGEGLTVNITVNGSMIGGPNVAAELSQMVVANLKLQGVRA
jgi:tape measure domain-containing protein